MKKNLRLGLSVTCFIVTVVTGHTNTPSIQSGAASQWHDSKRIRIHTPSINSIAVNYTLRLNYTIKQMGTRYCCTLSVKQVVVNSKEISNIKKGGFFKNYSI